MSQHEKIRKYMDAHGSITMNEAYEHLHITKLNTRISEMIRGGEKIEKKWETHKNADGEVSRYMRYSKAV